MTEMKNLIVVDITDNENTILEPTGIGATGDLNIKEIKANGTLLIKNTSQKSRLWNLTNDLKEVVNTNLDKVLNVGAVNPGQDFKREYEIQNIKGPCLNVVDVVDSERDISGTINNTFLYENANKANLKLGITNTLDVPITEITVIRDLPEIFQELEIKTSSIGTAEQAEEEGRRVLSWKIRGLGAKETANLEVYSTVVPKERKDQSLGPLKIDYLIDNKILTMINPEVRGETDSMSGVTRDEGSNPGSWDCNVEFINDSEFKVKLEVVKVTHKITTGTETVVSETPNHELEPDSSWDKDFPIESVNVPGLESEIVFTPLFGVITRVIGVINKEPTFYNVLSAEVHKEINPPEVVAYANTDMTIINTIPNKGTSTFDTLEIIDEIPRDFVPPLMKDVKIEVKNPDGNYELGGRAEFVEKLEIDPDDQSPDSKHVIGIKLIDIQKQVPAGAEIIVTYPLLAKNPRPEVRYNTPVEIKANVPVRGKDFVISPPEEPVLKIKYVQRKLKTLKSIKPGLSEGEFSISVRIQNKGDVELENVIVKDKIPSGFSLTEFTPPEGATHEVAEGELQVSLAEIRGGDSININYNCSGSGDYPRTEPNVVVLGRDGLEGPKASSESGAPPAGTETPKATVKGLGKEGLIYEVFLDIVKKLDRGIPAEKLADLLEEKRDSLPPGPVLHQILAFAKDMRNLGDKIVVGSLRDEVDAKINGFKSKYE